MLGSAVIENILGRFSRRKNENGATPRVDRDFASTVQSVLSEQWEKDAGIFVDEVQHPDESPHVDFVLCDVFPYTTATETTLFGCRSDRDGAFQWGNQNIYVERFTTLIEYYHLNRHD